MEYSVCQIQGRQYIVRPGQIVSVDKLPNIKSIIVDKVLMIVDGAKVEVGMPYLKKTLNFDVLESVKLPKIRVAKYHAKANYRRIIGSRQNVSKIMLVRDQKAVKRSKVLT